MAYRVKNKAKATVSLPYGASDTSIVLSTGHGARFNDTTTEGPFFFSWWNATDYPDPADDPNFEICLCTVRTGDTLATIVRGQDGSTASTKNTAGKTYKILAGITAAMWNQDAVLTQTFRNLALSTHPNVDVAVRQTLFSADAIIMNDGEVVTGWSNVVTDLSVNGVGGLDTASAQNSTMYEQYAIYDGTTKAGCLHRAKDWFLDLDITAGEDATQGIRSAVDNSTVRVAQGFTPVTAGKLVFIDVELIKVGTPTGNIWFTIEANNGGVPLNTPLATSWKFDVSRIPTTAGGTTMRIPFLVPATVSAATLYHVVAYGDWSVSATNYIGWRMDGSAAAYAGGSKSIFDSDTSTWTIDTDDDLWLRVYIERNNVDFATTVPSGYRYALIGYVYNDSGGNLVPFVQKDHMWRLRNMPAHGLLVNETSGALQFIDLRASIPVNPVGKILLTLTGTGAASALGVAGGLTATDISAAALTGETIGFHSVTINEIPYGAIQHLMVDYCGMFLDATAGADFYYQGFDW